MRSSKYDVSAGHCRKLGATIEKGGVNFAIWCEKASVMELLLFKSVDDDNPDIIQIKSSKEWIKELKNIQTGEDIPKNGDINLLDGTDGDPENLFKALLIVLNN